MRHHRPRLKLSPWLKRWLYASGFVLLASGAGWLLIHYLLSDPEGLPSPAEPWLMRLHGLASFSALLSLGAVAGQHLPQGWRLTREPNRRPQRRTGLVLCSLLGAVVALAYGLYYLIPESMHNGFGLLHTGLALASLAAWQWHRAGAQG
ncbi:hypothetical protein [Roseateles koreensis]|uniref:DUF4405 domain-containing protein n=1 Tax=Roseateles koreensis TaxID=2987526 RepID=A0ABT5KR65_9BURK|nr:hypothetical protein [Roseateles koreensis]MDC8785396.1 hypothetical protein [Roseateles koreensis]